MRKGIQGPTPERLELAAKVRVLRDEGFTHRRVPTATYAAVASATVVEVLGRSVRVRIDSVSGVPRSMRKEAAELMEGWHSLDNIKADA